MRRPLRSLKSVILLVLCQNADEAAKQLLKNQGLKKTCCTVCGEPVQYTTACPCSLTVTQQVALKDAKRRFTTPS